MPVAAVPREDKERKEEVITVEEETGTYHQKGMPVAHLTSTPSTWRPMPDTASLTSVATRSCPFPAMPYRSNSPLVWRLLVNSTLPRLLKGLGPYLAVRGSSITSLWTWGRLTAWGTAPPTLHGLRETKAVTRRLQRRNRSLCRTPKLTLKNRKV